MYDRARGACPIGTKLAIERVELPEAEIRRQGPDKRGVAILPRVPGNAREGHQQIVAEPAFRRLSEDMQAVANLHFLQFAEIIIELGER